MDDKASLFRLKCLFVSVIVRLFNSASRLRVCFISLSSVNTLRFTEQSDIDLLIEFDPAITIEEYADNYFSLRDRFVKLFNNPFGGFNYSLMHLSLEQKEPFAGTRMEKSINKDLIYV